MNEKNNCKLKILPPPPPLISSGQPLKLDNKNNNNNNSILLVLVKQFVYISGNPTDTILRVGNLLLMTSPLAGMESLDLTYKLFGLKIKSKTPDQIYFMSQVFQEHSHYYDKRKDDKKNENYENLFIFAATPSFSGRRVGLLQSPNPQLFSG